MYSEIVPHTLNARQMLAKNPSAIILSGGPSSVYAEGAPSIDPAVFEAGVPVLGICYGFQVMAQALGGTVGRTGTREYGHTDAEVASESCLFAGIPVEQVVWMSHGDAVQAAPAGFAVTATTSETPVAAFENRERRLFGLQWHPEVRHTRFGQAALENFLYEGAGLQPNWTSSSIIEDEVAKIRAQVGDAQVICALSGGVDSSVAAALVHKAVGDQLTCFFIDHGLLRAGEREQVEQDYAAGMGIRMFTIDESARFLDALAGVSEPETKRKIIGREFIRSFEAAERAIVAEAGESGRPIKFLVQGTLYPDVVESGGGDGAANIKSHHNVGGLPEDLDFELVEPLRDLFKDEVRAIGAQLGLSDKLVWRQPFPGPGLGVRVVGAITRDKLRMVRESDLIFRDEIAAAGLDEQIWQYFTVCPGCRSVGVTDGARTYGEAIVLRAVHSVDAMSADVADLPAELLRRITLRITSEVEGVNRVMYDTTPKPPGTIEWE